MLITSGSTVHDKMSNLQRVTLNYFQLAGMCTFTDPRHKLIERLLVAWNFIHILALVKISSNVIRDPTSMLSDKDTIGTLTDTIQLAGPIFAHLTCLTEAIRTKSLRCAIWRQFQAIDHRMRESLKNTNYDEIHRKSVLRYLCKVGVAHLVCFCHRSEDHGVHHREHHVVNTVGDFYLHDGVDSIASFLLHLVCGSVEVANASELRRVATMQWHVRC